jgi:3-hydroxyacyl-CoA dehydrogenase
MSVTYEVRDGVALALINRPPVNAIDVSIRKGLKDAIARAEKDDTAKIVLIACAGRTFLSGADLNEFNTGILEPGYYEVLGIVENCTKPVVASLHGMALGGGIETAMACHYRCAVADARVGMPEITLGIIPGAGGTQRLPRLVGARNALELLVKGAPIAAPQGKEMGLIDEIITGDPVEGGLAYARKLLAEGKGRRPTRDRKVDTTGFDEAGIAAVLKENARGLKGRTTQNDIIRTIKAAIEMDFDAGLAFEDQVSRVSMQSAEGRSLRHAFFAERETGHIPGLAAGVKPLPIAKVAVVGAGTMGGGIAMALADSGLPVTLIEAKQEYLDNGLKRIRENYEVSVKRGRLTPEALEKRMGLIKGTLAMEDARDADAVIEAVFEDMDLKKSILSKLDKVLRPEAVIASNTSSLSLTELASVTGRPDKVIGLHFFSPANVMRLLEIVRGDKTSQETIVTGLSLAKTLRKIGVVSGDKFGFIGNRMMLDGYFRESEQMLLEGVAPERIDEVAENFGFAMGPNKVNDMAGVDVGTKVRIELFKREEREAPYHAVSDALTPMGRTGQKAGKGVYRYEPGDRTPHHDPETDALIEKLAMEFNIDKREVSDKEIEERCVLPLINVGAQILEEGTAYRASDLDVVWINGYGFPRYRGGPMCYADILGLDYVLERIKHYQKEIGSSYWKPAPLIEKLVREGKSFADWDKQQKH